MHRCRQASCGGGLLPLQEPCQSPLPLLLLLPREHPSQHLHVRYPCPPFARISPRYALTAPAHPLSLLSLHMHQSQTRPSCACAFFVFALLYISVPDIYVRRRIHCPCPFLFRSLLSFLPSLHMIRLRHALPVPALANVLPWQAQTVDSNHRLWTPTTACGQQTQVVGSKHRL